MIATSQGCPGKSRLVGLLAVVAGEPVITVRMPDGLVHVATCGELWCTGVAAPAVGPGDGVITCFQCILDVAQAEATEDLHQTSRPVAAAIMPAVNTRPTGNEFSSEG